METLHGDGEDVGGFSADDDDTIEETDEEKLEIMVDNVDNLMIIFIDNSRLSTRVLDVMETIDDDCDRKDVVFVKVKVIYFLKSQ